MQRQTTGMPYLLKDKPITQKQQSAIADGITATHSLIITPAPSPTQCRSDDIISANNGHD